MRDTSLLNSGLLFELSWWHQRFGPVWGSALYTPPVELVGEHISWAFHCSGLFTPSRAFAAYECQFPGRMTGSSVTQPRDCCLHSRVTTAVNLAPCGGPGIFTLKLI